MLITTERRASCSMFARSCKHPTTWLAGWLAGWSQYPVVGALTRPTNDAAAAVAVSATGRTSRRNYSRHWHRDVVELVNRHADRPAVCIVRQPYRVRQNKVAPYSFSPVLCSLSNRFIFFISTFSVCLSVGFYSFFLLRPFCSVSAIVCYWRIKVFILI